MANKTISIDLLIQTAKSVKSTEAQKSVLLDIYEALKRVEKGSTAFDQLTEASNELTKSLGGVNASFEDIYGDLKPLSSRLGEIEDRMYEMALAGNKNTQEFKELQAEAINMRRTIIDVDASVDSFAQKGARLNGFIGTLSGIAGGFAVVQGTMALLGSENEDLEKGLLKVQSALAVLNGLQEINRLITEKNIVVQGILNVVMKANPIFLLVGVITAVVGAYALFIKTIDKSTKSLESQAKANDKVIDRLDKEIEINKKLGNSIEDLRKKRIDAYNEKIKIDTESLKEEQKKLGQTLNDYINTTDKILGIIPTGIYKEFFGVSEEDVKEIEDKIKEIELSILDSQSKIISEKKEGSDEIIDNKVGELERERALAEANGKETIKLDRAIIEEKKKLYKVDSEEYKDLINEKKILDIEYNRDLKEKLEERRKLWADAINDISEFNIDQGFVIDEETIQGYSDSIYKIIELRRLQGLESERQIDKEYNETKKALNDSLTELKKQGKLKVNEVARVQAEIAKLEENRQKRIENNTDKTEKEITSIIEEEAEKRRKLVESYTKDVLSPDEYERFVDFNESLFRKTKLNMDRLMDESGEILDNESLAKEVAIGYELLDKLIIKTETVTDKNGKSFTEIVGVVKDITEEQLRGITDVIQTSIGESEKALDLLDNIYDNKSSIILKTIDDINKTLKDPKTQEALTFSLTPKEGEIGLDELVNIDPDAVKKLGDALNKEFDDLTKKENETYSNILYDRYVTYKNDIEQVGLTEKEKSTIRKEYIKDTEKLQEDHNDKMIIIDLAYGKVSQEDLVEYFKKKNDKIEKENQKEIDLKKKLNEQLLTLEQQLQDAALSIYNNSIDMRLKANDRLYEDTIAKIDAEETAYNEQFVNRTALEQAKYDTQLAFDNKRANAERKRQLEEDRLNKKRFIAQKANDSATAGINTAVAVTKTVAELGGVGAITPPGAALIAAVIAGGLVQQASILSQEYIPAYAKGGLVTGPGTGTSDSINAKLSNGEVVINAKSASAFAPLLDAINQAGGGVAIPYVKKPKTQSMNKSDKYDFTRLEEAIYTMSDRPIETFVTEKSITQAQMRAKKLNDRTSF